MIYLSTGLLEKKSTSSIVSILDDLKITNLELSSGPYEKNINNFLIKKKNKNKFNFLIHNYFPVPKKAFVLNLASNNSKIRNESSQPALNVENEANESENDTDISSEKQDSLVPEDNVLEFQEISITKSRKPIIPGWLRRPTDSGFWGLEHRYFPGAPK